MSPRNGQVFDELPINKKIKELDNQSGDAFKNLCQFTEIMREKLNQFQWYRPVAYTPHDFDQHIMNVLINASQLIKKQLDKFSIDELCALQYACILHDIDMAYNPYQREIHSENGAKILSPYDSETISTTARDLLNSSYQHIEELKGAGAVPDSDAQELLDNIRSTLNNIISFLLPDEYIRKAVSRIILGHSDIKLNSSCHINTLYKEFYSNIDLPMGPDGSQMKIRVLAAVLRLADELDCSKRRIRLNVNPVYPPEARDYWDKLRIISSVAIDSPQIKLIIDNGAFSSDMGRNFKLLKSIEDKIEQERHAVEQCIEEENFTLHFTPVALDWTKTKSEYMDEYSKYKIEQNEIENKKKKC